MGRAVYKPAAMGGLAAALGLQQIPIPARERAALPGYPTNFVGNPYPMPVKGASPAGALLAHWFLQMLTGVIY